MANSIIPYGFRHVSCGRVALQGQALPLLCSLLSLLRCFQAVLCDFYLQTTSLTSLHFALKIQQYVDG